jgi:hypothetical protein
LEHLASFYSLQEINRAAADTEEGAVVKSVLHPSA